MIDIHDPDPTARWFAAELTILAHKRPAWQGAGDGRNRCADCTRAGCPRLTVALRTVAHDPPPIMADPPGSGQRIPRPALIARGLIRRHTLHLGRCRICAVARCRAAAAATAYLQRIGDPWLSLRQPPAR